MGRKYIFIQRGVARAKNMKKSTVFQIVALWLVWAIILIGFQQLVTARFQPKRPDGALGWTLGETGRVSQKDQLYLNEPFLNEMVSWDSEYYLSIASGGYDDPATRWAELNGEDYSLNYAFFPFYPIVVRLFAFPLSFLGFAPLATTVLSGVLVSLLGTLLGLFALYGLSKEKLGHDGAMRALFFLLIFPSGFFLAQVYTEGLFIGLAFTSLALMKRKRGLFLASIFAAAATMTRAVGAALVPVLFLSALDFHWEGWKMRFAPIRQRVILRAILSALVPTLVFFLWKNAHFGINFQIIEDLYFGRGALVISKSLAGWYSAWQAVQGQESYLVGIAQQSQIYFSLELAAVILGLIASITALKKYPLIAIFSLAAWTIAVFSGSPQSIIRYMLVLPALPIFLSRLGRNPTFERAWTIISILLMGLLATLFSFDFWVA